MVICIGRTRTKGQFSEFANSPSESQPDHAVPGGGHNPSAAEQVTTRLIHALRSLASVAIWSACILHSSYPNKH